VAGNPFYQSAFWKALRLEALKRDRYRCTMPGCPHTAASARLFVDHVETRPRVPHPTTHDTLANLRTLCASHDAQVKENQSGVRNRGGITRGCDPSGRPLDPNHHWNRKGARL